MAMKRPLGSPPMRSWSPPPDREDIIKHGRLRVNFRLGCSTISGIGDWNDDEHPNVLRLSILRNSFDHAVISFLLRLPLAIQSLIRPIFPGYFLPLRIVVKKLKPGRDEEFDNEKRMYKRLEALQGRLIPRCYGRAGATARAPWFFPKSLEPYHLSRKPRLSMPTNSNAGSSPPLAS